MPAHALALRCEEEAAHAPRPPAKELVQRALATVLRRYDVDSTLPSAPPPAAAPAVAPAPAATQEAGTLSETVVAWMRTHGYEPLQAGDAFTLLHVDDALTLRRVFEALRDVAPTHTELVLTLSAHAGLRVQAFGPNDVSLCDCVLAPRFFGALHVDSERCLGVSVAAMSTFLRQAQRRDTLTLLQRTHDPSVCDLVLCDASRVMHYALRLKQLQPRLLHITQPPRYDAELRVDAAQWQRALRELKAHAPAQDTVTLHVTGKATVLEAQARYGTVALTLAPRDVEVASFAQRFTGHFMLSTLLSFTRATPLATHARLRVCAHEPLMLAYELPDGSGHLHYYLAPKIAPSTAPF